MEAILNTPEPTKHRSRGVRWIVTLIALIVLGIAAVPVYFRVIEPLTTKTDRHTDLLNGPGSGLDHQQYHWNGVFDVYQTRVPFRGRSARSYELAVMLIMVTDLPGGSRLSGGGGSASTAHDASDRHWDLHISSSAREDLFAQTDMSQSRRMLEERSVRAEGDSRLATIAGKTYDLSKGRVFFVDGKGQVQQLDWLPFEPTPENLDEQVRHMLHQHKLMPR